MTWNWLSKRLRFHTRLETLTLYRGRALDFAFTQMRMTSISEQSWRFRENGSRSEFSRYVRKSAFAFSAGGDVILNVCAAIGMIRNSGGKVSKKNENDGKSIPMKTED